MDDSGVRTLNEVRYIPELSKNLISLCTLQENGFSYKSHGDNEIMNWKGFIDCDKIKKECM